MHVRLATHVLAALLVVAPLVGCGSTGGDVPLRPTDAEVEALYADTVGLVDCYPEVSPGLWASATPGEPVSVCSLRSARSARDVYDSLSPQGFCYVPVVADGELLGMFTVQWLDGAWHVADEGGDVVLQYPRAVAAFRETLGPDAGDFQVVYSESNGLLVVGRTDSSVGGYFLYPPDMYLGPAWLAPPQPMEHQVYKDGELAEFLH